MLNRKDIFALGFMIFALFFGAGNLIFPPELGALAGTQFLPAMLGFIVTGVGLPLVGLIAVAWVGGGISTLANPLPKFVGALLTFALYVAIGPFFGIPRTSVVTYELGVVPFLSGPSQTSLMISSSLFFLVTLYLVLKPGKLLDIIGRFITPLLLVALATLSISSIMNPLSTVQQPAPGYASFTDAFIQGFLQGYLTLDALGALVFGVIILHTLHARGLKNRTVQLKTVTRAGLIAAVSLILVYTGLGFIGRNSFGAVGSVDGPSLLQQYADNTFGTIGLIILGIAILLACLTTSVGLVTAFSEYLMSFSSRLSLPITGTLTTVLGFAISIFGLNTLLTIAVPVLMFLYPIVIVLIGLTFIRSFLKRPSLVYRTTLFVTALFSLLSALTSLKVLPGILITIYKIFPLTEQNLAWLLPVLVTFVISSSIGHVSKDSIPEKRIG
ncbi:MULTISPECIES: branched-chain amino acid transport system II carrier protein [Exiguobacterium]|uniref:Branched-chain amino acid transport system carrier protein n=1 Tax=Exiguobacterium antarcticum TaxID=132920 RepID=A0ABT6R162_9BACL|nr:MULTISPECIES: branched-chain amino acid transport system II carrier protein [Exiguobacterium]AFS70988.1 Branched-chain amino acid transport protein [Exiguobacterium antarcticum B7]MCT4778670.1 branched-chain amino acid transport system II carrier protein [Exiguobacterium soli]MDI3234580.1 branched-chain amino acid transport system II carrier protein [Exiguobacterium antarcticum]